MLKKGGIIMGFGLLLGLGLKLGGDIAYAVSDIKHKSKPAGRMPDGSLYYIDRACNQYAENGEKIIYKTAMNNRGCLYGTYVGERTGRVYWSEKDKVDKKFEELKKKAIEEEALAFSFLDEFNDFSNRSIAVIELSTGRCLHSLEYNREKGECRKYYLNTVTGKRAESVIISPTDYLRIRCVMPWHWNEIGERECLLEDMSNGRVKYNKDELPSNIYKRKKQEREERERNNKQSEL